MFTTTTKVPCADKAHIFIADAIGYHPSLPEYADITDAEREYYEQTQPELQQAAKDVCFSCPEIYGCARWALENNVFGVAGGLTVTERIDARNNIGLAPVAEDNPDDTSDKILALLSTTQTFTEIAAATGVSRRSVGRIDQEARLAARLADIDFSTVTILEPDEIPFGQVTDLVFVHAPRTYTIVPRPAPEPTLTGPTAETLAGLPAGNPIPLDHTVSGLTAAALDLLLDGEPRTRDEILAVTIKHVSDDHALREWVKMASLPAPCTDVRVLHDGATLIPVDERIRRGARRKANANLGFLHRAKGYLAQPAAHTYQITREAAETWAKARGLNQPTV